LQLLGQGQVALRCDFIFESIDLGTDASSKAKVILGSTTHHACLSFLAAASFINSLQNVPAYISPSPSGTVCIILCIQAPELMPMSAVSLTMVLSALVVGVPYLLPPCPCFFTFLAAPGIRALESIPPSDCLSFDDAFCSNIIVDSSALADAITDIEWWGEEVSLSMSSNEPIQLETCCAYGRCSIRMNSSSDVFSRVSIHPSSPSCSYKVHLLKQFSKSLGLSNRTGITVSSKGFSPLATCQFAILTLRPLQAYSVLR
jgi:hypothetical protein